MVNVPGGACACRAYNGHLWWLFCLYLAIRQKRLLALRLAGLREPLSSSRVLPGFFTAAIPGCCENHINYSIENVTHVR
jgi:hypothetical protein